MGVGLDNGAVHECAGVALVGIADEILLIALGLTGSIPLEPGGEARAAAACKAGGLDLFDYVLGSHGLEDLFQRLVAVIGGVGVDLVGVDDAAVTQSDAGLLGEELLIIGRNTDAVQLGHVAGLGGFDDGGGVLGSHLHAAVQLALFVIDIDDGLQIADTDAAGDGHGGVHIGGKELIQLGMHGTGAGGQAAGTFANYDTNAHASASFLRSRRICLTLSGVREP